jgi:DNA-binding MarR family transcriptional regulator
LSSARPDTVERFHHLAIALLRSLRKVDEANALAGPRASALSVLVFRGPQSLGELAAAEGVKPPTMSRLVKSMQAEGLVESRAAAHDQRAVRIAASAKGRRLMLRGREKRLAAIRELVRDASAEERKALETVVELLARSLGKR